MDGEPTAYPGHGDYDGCWNPNMIGQYWHQWVRIKLATPVVVTSVEVYETW